MLYVNFKPVGKRPHLQRNINLNKENYIISSLLEKDHICNGKKKKNKTNYIISSLLEKDHICNGKKS